MARMQAGPGSAPVPQEDSLSLQPEIPSAPDVYHGVYFAGSRPLLTHEADLKYEFAAQQIYLIRYAQVAGLDPPATSLAEALSYSLLVHGSGEMASAAETDVTSSGRQSSTLGTT